METKKKPLDSDKRTEAPKGKRKEREKGWIGRMEKDRADNITTTTKRR